MLDNLSKQLIQESESNKLRDVVAGSLLLNEDISTVKKFALIDDKCDVSTDNIKGALQSVKFNDNMTVADKKEAVLAACK